eukprot:5517990-Amphidinium_carterae.1
MNFGFSVVTVTDFNSGAYEARDATSTAKDAMTFDMQWDTGYVTTLPVTFLGSCQSHASFATC